MDAHRSQNADRLEARRSARSGDARPRSLDEDALAREAVRYLARWESTRQGVREVLLRRLERAAEANANHLEPPRAAEADANVLERLRAAIPGIVEDLAARGYVDDRRYAQQAIASLRRKGRSRLQIREQLRTKGVADGIIEETLRAHEETCATGAARGETSDPELAAAWSTARRRRLGPYHHSPEARRERRERDLAVLARAGFSAEIAHRVVDAEAPPGAGPGGTAP